MADNAEFLWYIPNQAVAGHRGDVAEADHNSLATLTAQARAIETHGWDGALLGAGWGRPDCFTVGTALAAVTQSFSPLVAIRPGYWHPAQFASASATLDHLSGGRLRINIISGRDEFEAYGDTLADQAQRYERTAEFMALVRRLWRETEVTHEGRFYSVQNSTAEPRLTHGHPRFYFGGASDAAERVAAAQADIQLFWGEPRAAIAERIARLRSLSAQSDRDLPPLEFGLRITTLIRETREEAWRDAEAKVAKMAQIEGAGWHDHRRVVAHGQQRLLDLQAEGEVLDECLYTTPGKFGAGGAATTWLVGSLEDVAQALAAYHRLGVTSFILSDTPYIEQIEYQGRRLLPRLRALLTESVPA